MSRLKIRLNQYKSIVRVINMEKFLERSDLERIYIIKIGVCLSVCLSVCQSIRTPTPPSLLIRFGRQAYVWISHDQTKRIRLFAIGSEHPQRNFDSWNMLFCLWKSVLPNAMCASERKVCFRRQCAYERKMCFRTPTVPYPFNFDVIYGCLPPKRANKGRQSRPVCESLER